MANLHDHLLAPGHCAPQDPEFQQRRSIALDIDQLCEGIVQGRQHPARRHLCSALHADGDEAAAHVDDAARELSGAPRAEAERIAALLRAL